MFPFLHKKEQMGLLKNPSQKIKKIGPENFAPFGQRGEKKL